MTVKTERVEVLADQFLIHLPMGVVALETVLGDRRMRRGHLYFFEHIVMTTGAQLNRRFREQRFLRGSVRIMTIDTLTIGHREVRALRGDLGKIVTGNTEIVRLVDQTKGLRAVRRVVAAFAFATLNRGMERVGQQVLRVRRMNSMAGSTTFVADRVFEVSGYK